MDGVDILQSIDRFIDSRMYHYALLINGGWGIGKTYFVKETLMPHVKKTKKDVHYVSLYGIQSTDEISQMLLAQTINRKVPASKTKKGQIATKIMSVLFKGGVNHLGLRDKDIVTALKDIPNYDNSVFVFDDLERCGCPINEILGYINNFIEHSDVSVILVANEKEIGKWQVDHNLELQTLIALDSRINIELPLTTEDFINGIKQDEKVKKTTFTLDEIEYRRKAIFHSNESYRAIKEKVIGLTIDYEPNLSSIFKTLIEKNITDLQLQEELLKDVEWFVMSSEKDGHNNLRTFQYFLEKISVIFQIIQDNYQNLHQLIIRYTFRSAIRYMKGLELPKWDGEYGAQSFGKSQFSPDQEFGFRFIDDLILTNGINDLSVNSILTNYVRIEEKKNQLFDDPYQQIMEWWLSEDEQVATWLNGILKNIQNGKYTTDLYTELIKCLAELKSNHVLEDKCDQIFLAMQEYIKSVDPKELMELDRARFILDDGSRKYYKNMIEKTNGLIESALSRREKQQYIDAIQDKDNWGTNLLDLISFMGVIKDHSFVYWLEPDNILQRISESSVSELYQFQMALRHIYDSTVYYEKKQDDYDHLVALRDGIDALDSKTWDLIKRINIVWFVNTLDEYIDIIKK